MDNPAIRKLALGMVSICVLGGILFATLEPFNFFPRNGVRWLKNQNGLAFDGNGILWSSEPISWRPSVYDEGCSLEIGLYPDSDDDVNAFLTFFRPELPDVFTLRQSGDALQVQRESADDRFQEMTVDHAFHGHGPLLITVTSGLGGTAVYLNGASAAIDPAFKIDFRNFSGQLFVGTSPVMYSTWAGQLHELAIYNQELTKSEVAGHGKTWSAVGSFPVYSSDRAVVLYTFKERTGRIVRNQVGGGPDLYIPPVFQIPHKPFLAMPWNEFSPSWSYVADIVRNIVGFVPLGFFVYAFLMTMRENRTAAYMTVILGAVVSLTIEILQAYIPRRTSGLTDVITNTAGTLIGVLVYRAGVIQAILAKIRLRSTILRSIRS